jgi:acyl-CoA synthetase (AMP-forming)/AMP-acid ligase II
MPNCLEFYLAYWALARIGAVIVPVNIRLRPEEMAFVFSDVDAKALVAHRDTWGAVSDALTETAVEHVILAGAERDGALQFDRLAASSDAEQPDADLSEDDLALIAYTSGTTGQPKGAMIDHGNVLFNIRMCLVSHSWRHEDVHLLVVPMFHCTALYSMLPSSAYLGSTIVIAPRPSVRELAELIQQHGVTTFISVPTLFHMLVTMKGLDQYDLSSLKAISYAGSTMPPATIRRLREAFPHVELRNFFGMTETISVTHVLPSGDALERGDSVGKALPDVGVRIMDDSGNELPPGQVGELCFHRSNVIKDYWKRSGLLDEAFTGDWFRSGDLALVDDDGYLYLRGRSKDMIIVGGENVYALEVENILTAHEAIKEAAVVGVEATGPRAYLGELIKAFVVLERGASLEERDVKRLCADRLTTYKVPHFVEFIDALPRNAAGKVLKRDLR